MKRRTLYLFLLACSLVLAPQVSSAPQGQARPKPERAHVTVLTTTDLHGNILPIDYYTNKPDERGLAKAATLIRQVRRENPNTLLIDSGDTIQGTPLAFYHNRKNNAPPDPMMLTMSALGFDAMAVGNHEFNFGLKVLEKARREAKFPWLSANTYLKDSGRTYFDPYLVKNVGGVRVGILGLTTPGVPSWDNPQNYEGLEFREPVAEARRWVSVLRDKEKVDLVVVAMHMGIEMDLKTGELFPGQVKNENAAVRVAQQVPGIDLILMGHTHRDVPAAFINGVLLTQSNAYARQVNRADLYLEKTATGRWQVVAKTARAMPVNANVAVDAEIAKLAEPYDRQTQAWLDKVIGESPADLSAEGARFRDSALLDLIHRAQLDAGKADVSMAAIFNTNARIEKGPVTTRDMAELYIYENTLVVLEVTGRQLKDALEHSAKYFRAWVPNSTPADLVDEKIPGYNFDIAEGVTYELDLTKPVGQRIQNLRFRGKPVEPDQKFRLATNNYRVNGGGGYDMYAGAPVLYRSGEEIRELIIEWVERNRQIPAEPTNNWRIVTR